uniref:Cytochrome c6 n=1 Tax=Antithamnionella ternifolia TaxID=207919 RepID=A0A4D6WIT2_9FLOR|nr:cytochrome c553 [Antithamnionella ternifolia]
MRSFFSILFIFNFLYALNLSPTLAADLEAGGKIFNANCTACHIGGNNLIMPSKTLKIEDLDQYKMSSVEAITTQVMNGKNAMPAFQGRLSADDINNVANYVLNQSQSGWDDE